MNKLSKSIPTKEQIDELVDIVDDFELQQVHSVLGDKMFLTLVRAISEVKDVEARISIFSTMDKLLHSDYRPSYNEEYPTVRNNKENELKEETSNAIIENDINHFLYLGVQELPSIGNLDNVQNTLKLLTTLSIVEDFENDEDFDLEPTEVLNDFVDSMRNSNSSIEDVLDKLYILNSDVSENHMILSEFEELEVNDFLDYLIK